MMLSHHRGRRIALRKRGASVGSCSTPSVEGFRSGPPEPPGGIRPWIDLVFGACESRQKRGADSHGSGRGLIDLSSAFCGERTILAQKYHAHKFDPVRSRISEHRLINGLKLKYHVQVPLLRRQTQAWNRPLQNHLIAVAAAVLQVPQCR